MNHHPQEIQFEIVLLERELPFAKSNAKALAIAARIAELKNELTGYQPMR